MAPRPRRFGSPGAAPAQGCSTGPGTTGVSRGQAKGWRLLGATRDRLGDHPAAWGAGGDGVTCWHHSGQDDCITLWATSQTCLLSAWGFCALCSPPGPAGRGSGQAHLVLVARGTHEPCPACCHPLPAVLSINQLTPACSVDSMFGKPQHGAPGAALAAPGLRLRSAAARGAGGLQASCAK